MTCLDTSKLVYHKASGGGYKIPEASLMGEERSDMCHTNEAPLHFKLTGMTKIVFKMVKSKKQLQ